ncbi:MAG: isoprenylcysteine carboxylmethyltransferase family protein [Thermoplasmatales archaeon]|nr:MAG: isoprenylcysteine carboxylmethyltransferase family protein [Thermoplasmatales archaeon]
MNDKSHNEKLGIKLVMKSISIFIVFLAVTFITAGRLDYWQGWVFNGLNIFFILVTYIVLIDQKDLIKERLKPGKGMKKWDRVYYAVSTPIFFAILIVSVLDAGRFYWKPIVPLIIIFLGIIMYSIGQIIIIWSKKTNKFFSSVVRIQLDRKHKVCSDGPYRFVRHPGYLGGLIFTIATPFVLGSFWGLIPAIIAIIFVFGRTYLEDKTLIKELTGYKDYAKKVRYRLIPFIW